MATLLHIADEKDSEKIRVNGIKIGKGRKGVFFMPVTPDFYASHQWIRELRRRGAKTLVGVYFKLPSTEEVWYGHYSKPHRKSTIAKAVSEYMQLPDKLGWEFLLERKIEASEIHKIQAVPQKTGWRYFPESHTYPLNCDCPICISYGDINA